MCDYGSGYEYNPYGQPDYVSLFAMACILQVVEWLSREMPSTTPRMRHLAYRHKRERTRKKNQKRMGLYDGR